MELKAAGIPVPADFSGDRKSYTLPADREQSRCAIGVLCPLSILGQLASSFMSTWHVCTFTLKIPCIHTSMYLRWMAGSFYIYAVPKETTLPEGCGLQLNSSNGCTVSFKKRGGLAAAWQLAKTIANWP